MGIEGEHGSLCPAYNPSLPLPLLELFLWLRSNDVLNADEFGSIPLHLAISVGSRTPKKTSTTSKNVAKDWCSFVGQLIDASPESCRVDTTNGRLPLHLVLSFNKDCKFPVANEVAQARHSIVEKLIGIYPESVDKRDPSSGLYPFMMAARDQSLSLDTVFCLLRHSPSQCDGHPSRPLKHGENL